MSTTRNEKRNRKRKAGSTAYEVVRVRGIQDGVLFIVPAVPPAKAQARLRGAAVIEVEGTTFSLRSDEDRAALVLGYQALLKAIPPERSIQVLIRRQPHDLSAYIQKLDTLANERGVAPIYRQLASAHADHLERLSGLRPLYRSRCYLVVSALDERQPSFALPLLSLSRKRRRQAVRQRQRLAIQDDLDIQCERYLAALTGMGLSAHRLNDDELAQLAASCLVAARDEQRGLPDLTRLAIGEPVRVATPGTRATDALRHPTEPFTMATPTTPRIQNGWVMGVLPNQNLLPDARTDGRGQEQGQEQGAKHPDEDGKGLPLAGWTHLADLLAPSALEERPNDVQVEGEYVRTLAVVGYPREVPMGFLAPLLTHDDHLDISIHVQMQDPAVMLRRYRRRKAELRASKRLAARQGWVDNPDEQVSASDVERLLLQVASRQEMLCEVGLYIQVHARTVADLDERTDRLLALLRNLLLVAHPTTFEHLVAYHTMQPWGDDQLRRTTLLDTMSVAFGFPFVSNALIMAGGVLEGVTATGEPVIIDDWADELDNPHRFIGAVTGAGKSYACKLKMMRELLVRYHEGVQVAVIDPEREYERLCHELGGTFVRLAPGSVQHLNPFDLVPPGINLSTYLSDHSRGDRLAEKVQGLHALYDLMLSDRGPTGVTPLSTREKGLLDRATYEAYRRLGITSNLATHGSTPPLLRNLYEVLSDGSAGKDEYGLCDRLYRYVEGSLAGTFSAPTDVKLDSRFVVFDVREMSGELRPIGMLLIADFMWTQVLASPRPRVLYIDEAWSLIAHSEGGRFLADLSRRARKRYLRLVTITQSPELFVDDPYGAVIAGNAATKLLKKQDRTSAQAVASRFGLTLSERQKLLSLHKPEALLLAGGTRLVVTLEANPLEHRLATTNPRELAQIQQAQHHLSPLPVSAPTDLVSSGKEHARQ
jgi:hypothetical protein